MTHRTLIVALAAGLVLFAASSAFAQDAARPTPAEISVEELASQLAEGGVTVCDANGAVTRANYGTIPGAILLDSYAEYDPSAIGAPEGSYVFYCANTMCSAAPAAARRAMEAGYQNVSVLRAGIIGWVEAGQEVAAYQAPAEEAAPAGDGTETVTQ